MEPIEQVPEFKYLGCMFFKMANLMKGIEHRRMDGNSVMAQLKSQIFNKPELSNETNWKTLR